MGRKTFFMEFLEVFAGEIDNSFAAIIQTLRWVGDINFQSHIFLLDSSCTSTASLLHCESKLFRFKNLSSVN